MISNSLINFVDLTLDEKKIILSWRNHSSIREWMYNHDEITLENHLAFIESLKLFTNKLYFVVKQNTHFIGVIDFTKIEKEKCDFGLYANPFEKTLGIGTILMESGIRYAFDSLKISKLQLEVFENNTKALHLYKKFGFYESGVKILNDKKIVCMKLTKDIPKIIEEVNNGLLYHGKIEEN